MDTVAAMLTDVSVGFASDFLEVPMKITTDWIERVVHGSSDEFDGKGGDHQNRVILELKTFYGV